MLELKKRGFHSAPNKGRARKQHGQNSDLTSGKLELSEEGRSAWDTLKDRLCNAPTLNFPDFEKDFILYCDGSKERGFGAALHQIDPDGVERPILFLSKSLLPHEKNYWATEREVAALV